MNQVAMEFGGQNILFLALAVFIIICIMAGVRIVPQSQKFVVERLGRLRVVLGPGINFIVPFLDRVRHKVSRAGTPVACDVAGRDYIGQRAGAGRNIGVSTALSSLKRRFTVFAMLMRRFRQPWRGSSGQRLAGWSWIRCRRTVALDRGGP